jgi:hypothetical protein
MVQLCDGSGTYIIFMCMPCSRLLYASSIPRSLIDSECWAHAYAYLSVDNKCNRSAQHAACLGSCVCIKASCYNLHCGDFFLCTVFDTHAGTHNTVKLYLNACKITITSGPAYSYAHTLAHVQRCLTTTPWALQL